jgi:hypothetical protein
MLLCASVALLLCQERAGMSPDRRARSGARAFYASRFGRSRSALSSPGTTEVSQPIRRITDTRILRGARAPGAARDPRVPADGGAGDRDGLRGVRAASIGLVWSGRCDQLKVNSGGTMTTTVAAHRAKTGR